MKCSRYLFFGDSISGFLMLPKETESRVKTSAIKLFDNRNCFGWSPAIYDQNINLLQWPFLFERLL